MSLAETGSSPQVGFLVVGMARSGTTVVQRLLAELPGVWIPPETHFWRHALALAKRVDFPLTDQSAREAASWFASLNSSIDLEIDVDDIIKRFDGPGYLWDLFEAVTSSLSPPEAEILGEKTPDHAFWAVQLLRVVPHLKVFGVVRDPREVFRSHQELPWGLKDPLEFAEKWVEHARTLVDLTRLFPERSVVTRYEDVVADPEGYRTRCARVVLPGDTPRGVVEPIEVSALYGPNEWWKESVGSAVAPKADRWPTEVEESDVAAIEWRAGYEMKMFGYTPVSDHERPPAFPLIDAQLDLRTHSAKAAAVPLPIGVSSLAAWQQSDSSRAQRWWDRAQELNADAKRLASDVGAWRDQAREVAKTSAVLADRNRVLEGQSVRLGKEAEQQRISASSWKARAEELNSGAIALRQEARRERANALKAERRRLVATGKLRRMRARRWWRLGGVLGQWRRAPHRVGRLAMDLWRLVAQPGDMPPLPDLSEIDQRLEKLKHVSRSDRGPYGRELTAAEAAYAAGNYEACLEILDGLPGSVRYSSDVQKLSRNCYIKLGEVTKALASVQLALADRDDPKLRRQARVLVGRLRETDPAWLPEVGLSTPEGFAPTSGRILHILKESLPFFERGYTMRSHMTLMAQRHAGYEPSVVTSLGFPRDQGFKNFPVLEVIDDVVHHRLDLGEEYAPQDTPYDQILADQATLTARLANEIKPELIQAGSGYRGYETALVGLAVARHLAVPMIYEIRSFLEQTWTANVDRSEEGEYYQRRHDQETRCLTEADFVITIAEAMRDEIAARGIPHEKIAVVPNVVDVHRFRPREKPQELVKRYRLGGRVVLGYISNLSAREGVDNLIRGVHILRQQGRDVAGLVVGDGPEMEALSDLVGSLGLDEHFTLTGHVPNEQIEDHYALIDLFVVPRINDRASRLVTPLKPLEAMAMGIPVIAADLPALRELVAPGSRGEVFIPEDPGSLADVSASLLESEQTRISHATRAREWVLSERTVEANAARYREIIETVTRGR